MSDPFVTLRRSLVAPAWRKADDFDRRPRGQRGAAVLLLLSDEPDPKITFVRRSASLRRHAGQIALPGGRIDETDAGPVDAALREAWEEVGLELRAVDVLGSLPALWVPKSNYDVTTVVGLWSGGLLFPVDAGETAQVQQIAVSCLAAAEVRVTSQHPSGFRGPAFALPEAFVWGLTAHIVDWVLDLGGWSTDWDHGRVVSIPEEYLRD